jgi:dTDP-4-amino-4,6-dideoxygalactose transaminase
VQLVFDTNILVDAILARGHFYPYAVQVLEMVARGECEGWYTPHSLTTVHYLVEKTLALQSQNHAQATQAARAVVGKVLGLLKPLPQVGNEFLTLDPQPGDDLEDLLIVTLASRYLPQPLIVTRDKWMLRADRPWQAAHPKEIVEAGGPPAWMAPRRDQPLSFVDLATQQRAIWPGLAQRLHTVLHHGHYILGPEVRELEARLAAYTGARHGLPVIEDAAQSFGADYRGHKSGNLSTLGCTSFFPSKPLGGYGDGGAILTNDDALAQACREIRVHGQSQRYVHTRIGVGGRMDTLQCAIVLAKLDRFDQEIAQRQAVARRYHELLATDTHGSTRIDEEPIRVHPCSSVARVHPCPSVAKPLPWPQADRASVFAQYTLRVPDRDALQARLQAAGIPTAVHYPVPLNEQPAYAHLCCPDCTPVARQMAREVISLPMHPDLNEVDQDRIVSAIAAVPA